MCRRISTSLGSKNRTPTSSSGLSATLTNSPSVELQNAVQSSEVKIGINTLGLSRQILSGVVMSELDGAVLDSYFPHDPRNSLWGTTEFIVVDSDPALIGQTAEICVAKSVSDCAAKSNIKSRIFQSAFGGTYGVIQLESF